MSKKTTTAEVKRGRDNRWKVSVGDEKLGSVDSLTEATSLLFDNGFKVWSYRRGETSTGKPKFTSNVLVFDKEKK